MPSRLIVTLALGFALLGPGAWAAKKYYPPGFTPPSDQQLHPNGSTPDPSAPQVIIQQVPGGKQVIIKTIPGKTVTKPRDPLLVLIDEHRYYDALRLVDTRLKKTPGNLSLQLLRGRILRDEGSFEQSINQFQTILERSKAKGTRAEALNGLGWTYYRKAVREKYAGNAETFEADVQSAKQAFNQAVQLSPRMAFAWAGLGQISLVNDQLQEAERHIKKANSLSSSSLPVQLAQANLLLAQKKPDDALQMLYGIKKTTTHDPDVYLLLARGSLNSGKTDDAIINLKQLLALQPEHIEGLKLLSQSYERKMKPEDAEQVLQKAITLNPGDEQSVEALVKIYDQRGQGDRSLLLLETLLKDRPGQAAYGIALLERLNRQGRWKDAYDKGVAITGPILSNPSETPERLNRLSEQLSWAVYQHGKGLLDRRALLVSPTIQRVMTYLSNRLQDRLAAGEPGLDERLGLLLIDPLAAPPKLPDNFKPTEKDLPTALQVAYLQGQPTLHANLLAIAANTDNRLTVASRLLDVGDYRGAQTILRQVKETDPNLPEVKRLEQRIAQDREQLQIQLDSLAMLPRKITDSYWEKAAGEVLKLGDGDWQTHARLSELLYRRRQPGLVLLHQQLAARYAANSRDRQAWARKAERTARQLSRAGSR